MSSVAAKKLALEHYCRSGAVRHMPWGSSRGMTPMEAIQSATSLAAHYMGWSDRVGALKPGSWAIWLQCLAIRCRTSRVCRRSTSC